MPSAETRAEMTYPRPVPATGSTGRQKGVIHLEGYGQVDTRFLLVSDSRFVSPWWPRRSRELHRGFPWSRYWKLFLPQNSFNKYVKFHRCSFKLFSFWIGAKHLQDGLKVPSQHSCRPSLHPHTPLWWEQHPRLAMARLGNADIGMMKSRQDVIFASGKGGRDGEPWDLIVSLTAKPWESWRKRSMSRSAMDTSFGRAARNCLCPGYWVYFVYPSLSMLP